MTAVSGVSAQQSSAQSGTQVSETSDAESVIPESSAKKSLIAKAPDGTVPIIILPPDLHSRKLTSDPGKTGSSGGSQEAKDLSAGEAPTAAKQDQKPSAADTDTGGTEQGSSPTPPRARTDADSTEETAALIAARRAQAEQARRRASPDAPKRLPGASEKDGYRYFTRAGFNPSLPEKVSTFLKGCPVDKDAQDASKRTKECFVSTDSSDRASVLSRRTGNWWGFSAQNIARSSVYYRSGYLLRLNDKNQVSAYLPVLGGALSIGNIWPGDYGFGTIPRYYIDYYDLGPQRSYRYANHVVYRLDSDSRAITGIAALLSGDRFIVGQKMPDGYDIYNIPSIYRQQYADSKDTAYRYADGYIYKIDPRSWKIRAAIELIAA
ncbi:hypothetical protein [Altericroceibacterium endophyticum]|uniref:Uncharacterized protein n=1 Tax=Altericroceibacterium endophyticum TaxID=1808508 RepID=A0A6I4T8W3_9SPHN|nr:hypothetical protein [Altericroceibacterium endophyticum]MXO66483.1 hypothetical protein [Altericroceibacterium endophyticum]